MAIAYTVIASFQDRAVADEYVAWLEGGHVDDVIRHGAHSAMIVRVDDPATPVQVETRYVFSTRDVFEDYLTKAAPALRTDGLRRFPPERGVSFQRRVGRIM